MIGGWVDEGVRRKPARRRRARCSVDAGRYAGRPLRRRAVWRQRVELVLAGERVGIPGIEVGSVAGAVNWLPNEVVAEPEVDRKMARRFDLILYENSISPSAASNLEDVSIAGFTGNTKQQRCPGVSSRALLSTEARSLRGTERRSGVCDRGTEVVGLEITPGFDRVFAEDFGK